MIDVLDFELPGVFEEDEDEDIFVPIAKEDYRPDLEEKVREYMLIAPSLPENTIKHEYVKIPDFNSPEQKKAFWFEQFRRCKTGHNGMCGKMYFFYHFCWMENITKGKIRPQFRVVDNEWFRYIEACQRSREWGIVCVKRRRVGASWKEAADVLHDVLFNKHFHVGMNSKSEKDSIALFRKVKFLYNNLPAAMRLPITSSTKMFLDFSFYEKDENGQDIRKGQQSDIVVVAPTDSAYEGMMLNKWVCDEAGKIVNLPQIWSYTEDCLMQETRRAGIPILFGTSGDVGKDGKGLRDMWEFARMYKLKRFFFSGWMGLAVDEFGNDQKEECIRWIVYKRREKEKNQKYLYDFIQKYPLTVDEAFMDFRVTGLGDPIKIKAQREALRLNEAVSVKGFFREDGDGKPVFVPDEHGACIIYEHPKPGAKYIAGNDPADIDDAFGDVSDLSTYIVNQTDGLIKPRIVFEYTDRPRELDRYYEQLLLALRYYNECRVLIERQKGGRLINFITEAGYKYLMMTRPQLIRRIVPGRAMEIGVHMQNTEIDYGRGLVVSYIDNSVDLIPSVELLDEFLDFGTKNTDKAMAFMITLIALAEVTRPKSRNPMAGANVNNKPHFKYVKGRDGRITRVIT
jgi:hypothetical protein